MPVVALTDWELSIPRPISGCTIRSKAEGPNQMAIDPLPGAAVARSLARRKFAKRG